MLHRHSRRWTWTGCLLLTLLCCRSLAADYPAPRPGDHILRDFRFRSGEVSLELKMHYLTFGAPHTNTAGRVDNAVLILHGTTGNSSNFLRAEFAGELFGPSQLLDATRYFLVLPDNIGHGQSSKPSDGLHGRFPHYGYQDMIEAQHRLLTEGLGVNHLRLVMGTSMGGDAHLALGRNAPGVHGCLDASGQPANSD